jgi:hypothetical protein
MGTQLTQGGDGRKSGLFEALDHLRGPGSAEAAVPVARPVPAVDLQLVTVDPRGRVPLRRSAVFLGWAIEERVTMEVDGGAIRLSPSNHRSVGVDVSLDRRLRFQLPHGIRLTTRFRPGVRLVVLAVREHGIVAAAPLSDLIDRLVRQP